MATTFVDELHSRVAQQMSCTASLSAWFFCSNAAAAKQLLAQLAQSCWSRSGSFGLSTFQKHPLLSMAATTVHLCGPHVPKQGRLCVALVACRLYILCMPCRQCQGVLPIVCAICWQYGRVRLFSSTQGCRVQLDFKHARVQQAGGAACHVKCLLSHALCRSPGTELDTLSCYIW